MRFLLDQDVYAQTAEFLRASGHDVLKAAEAGLSRAADMELMLRARDGDRLLVTRDRDFGHLALRRDLAPGILYLRMTPATMAAVHQELATILDAYDEDQLRQSFLVIQPGRHRLRRWQLES